MANWSLAAATVFYLVLGHHPPHSFATAFVHHHHRPPSSSTTAQARSQQVATLLQMTSSSPELEQLKALGLQLPPAPGPAANYIPIQRDGNLLYMSGHIPFLNDGKQLLTGKIGPNGHKTVQEGQEAARQVALNLIASLQSYLDGDLSRVQQIVKLFGVVHSTDDFDEQHRVMNGCSDVFVSVFGQERGMHARSAIGVNALPLGVSVEIEAIVRIKD